MYLKDKVHYKVRVRVSNVLSPTYSFQRTKSAFHRSQPFGITFVNNGIVVVSPDQKRIGLIIAGFGLGKPFL